jgi:phosphate transport system permease protein
VAAIATPERKGTLGSEARATAVWRELLARWGTFLCAALSILTTFGIVAVLLTESALFFRFVSPLAYALGTEWAPLFTPARYGVLPLICGTLLITVGAALFALPLGLLAAIYLSEYASVRTRRILKPTLELLAGVPTVVYGYFGVAFVTPLLRGFFPKVEIFNAASGAIVVGMMILPLVCSLCEDALRAVPKALREGGYGLGATKLEVVSRVLVPAALSGIVAAFLLALSRAIGETMAVALAAGSTPKLTLNPGESVQTMTAYIVQVSAGDTPTGSIGYQTIFAVGLTLFVITLGMNVLARRLVTRYRLVYS